MNNKNEKNIKKKSNGIGFLTILTIIFIILKKVGYISWPWVWVFAPIWIPLLILIIILAIILIGARIKNGKW